MIAAINYGANGMTTMAYYYLGRANNNQKLLNSGGGVEAGWLAGLNGTVPLGSNLPRRLINAYTNVTSTLRFDSAIVGVFKNIALFTMRPLSIAVDPTWKPYA